MNKTLRLSLISMLLAFCFAEKVNAQTVINFDNDYATLFPTLPGVSSSTGSTDGDFIETTTSTPVNGITVTVSAKTKGNNENRIWDKTPCLRMYSGTLTVKSAKPMKSIEFTGSAKNFNLSTETGTLEGLIWTGNATEVVFTCSKNTQISTMSVLLEGEEIQSIANTPETAYTVAQAFDIITAGVDLNTKVYVKGIISSINNIDTGQYGNAEYAISDDGTTAKELIVYRGYYLGGEKFTSEDQIKVGNNVVVYGKLVDYNGTYEFTSGSSIYSLNGSTNINDVLTDAPNANAPVYNLAGQRVSKNVKGILIQNGKKFVNNK